MKALSAEWTTSSSGFISIYQIKEPLEQQNELATYGGVFDHVQIDSYDIKTQAGVKEFINDLMPLLREYQQGYHAKHHIAKLYLNCRDGWSNEAREVNKQIIEQLDISKGYLSKVQAVMDFRSRKLPDNAELLAFFDGHPVTVQYYMTRLTAHEIEDRMLWGHQFTRGWFEAKVSPGNSGKPKQLTEKQQQDQDLLEKYQDKPYLSNAKAAAVYDSRPSTAAVFAAAMQILADQQYRNSDWINSVRELNQLTSKYLSLPFYRQ
jgi:hypothetical protein